ncbi:hypothetical protein MTR_7g109370 [Medicago truncatula]|uniref:Uncharacterized protein n=1 Tax=Medicago truncatula TaxID=3880 RepID=G7KSS2_MEDTR|nr:hypothetical protein MTR_7g109370 [Medicago truncatula]
MKNRGNVYFFYPRSRFYKLCSGLMIIKVMCLNKNKEFPEHKGKARCITRNTQDPPNNTIIVLVQKNRETKKQRAASKIYPGVKVEEERRVFGIVGLKIQKCHVETGWLECDDMASVWGNRCLGRRWGIYEFNYNARDFS